MKAIIFTADFATKKKGEEWLCDGMLASQLVNIDKVAKYANNTAVVVDEETHKKATSKKTAK